MVFTLWEMHGYNYHDDRNSCNMSKPRVSNLWPVIQMQFTKKLDLAHESPVWSGMIWRSQLHCDTFPSIAIPAALWLLLSPSLQNLPPPLLLGMGLESEGNHRRVGCSQDKDLWLAYGTVWVGSNGPQQQNVADSQPQL